MVIVEAKGEKDEGRESRKEGNTRNLEIPYLLTATSPPASLHRSTSTSFEQFQFLFNLFFLVEGLD